ncbi:MAG: prepilin peptidase [Dehalococcoidia bacterium]|nr:prepilin peptidase [Dehalococcoidia bacterium]
MAPILMTVLGVCVGLALDELISRLAREPFERREADAAGNGAAGSRPGSDTRAADHDLAAMRASEDDAAPGDGLRRDNRLAHRGDAGVSDAPGVPAGHALDFAGESGQVALPWSLTGGRAYRRALVVALTAVLFALVGRAYAGQAPAMLVAAAYVSVLLTCAATDIISYRVPNVVTYPAIVGALLIGLLWPGADRLSVAGGGLLAGGLFLACALLPGAPMGMGDVKLAVFIGFALGFVLVVQAMLVMAITGGAVALVLLALKVLRVRQVTYMFYAPFIATGAVVVLLAQGSAIHRF